MSSRGRHAWLGRVLCFVLGSLFGTHSFAEVIFSENWNSGVINQALWNVAPLPGKVALQQVAPNDWAIYSNGDGAHQYIPNGGTIGAWSGWFYSKSSFSRIDDTRVTFKVWGDPTKVGPWPTGSSINGPWHQTGSSPSYLGNEESVGMGPQSGPDSSKTYPHIFLESGVWDPPSMGLKSLSVAFQSAYAAASSKANAMSIRMWLGNTMGGRLEWSTDNVNWHLEQDTRGSSGGTQKNVFLGWGTQVGAVFVDDIVVERGGVVPPVPQPRFQDVSAALGPFQGDNTAAWGDYNNDGWPDLMTGTGPPAPGSGGTSIYRNEQGTKFTRVQGLTWQNVSGIWGDYNNDGRRDVYTFDGKLYEYTGPGQYSPQQNVYLGWGTQFGAVFVDDIVVENDQGLLLHENWSSGAVDSSRWARSASPGVPTVKEVAPGDFAVFTAGEIANSPWNEWLYSKSAFSRGNNTRVTFKVWGDPNQNSAVAWPAKSSINGPWHRNSSGPSHVGAEEAIGMGPGSGPDSSKTYLHQFLENGVWDPAPGDELTLSLEFQAAYQNASSKSSALTVRAWLGDDMGGKIEWTVDDVHWHAEYDTRGLNIRETFTQANILPAIPAPVSWGGTWGDFNGDSYLDLYVGGYESEGGPYYPDAIFMNNHGTSFTKTWQTPAGQEKPARGVTAADFDEDGDLDIYVSNYRLEKNNLLLNDGDANFTDVATARGVAGDYSGSSASYGHTIGSAWGDLDNDGHLDLFVGNFSHPWPGQDPPKFYRNMGPTEGWRFQDMTANAGLAWQESYASPVLADFNNDGYLDLFYTTIYPGDHSVLYYNNGDWTFTDVTAFSGVDGFESHGAAVADFDRDGWLDLYSHGRLYRNTGGTNHWLEIHLIGDDGTVNRDAIGAQIRIALGDQILTRQVESATGQNSENDLTVHFGLGVFEGPLTLEITWPGGAKQLVTTSINRLVTIHKDRIYAMDLAAYVAWRNALGSTADLRADFDGDGAITLLDYDVWRTHFGSSLFVSNSGLQTAIVPEPASLAAILVCAGTSGAFVRRTSKRNLRQRPTASQSPRLEREHRSKD